MTRPATLAHMRARIDADRLDPDPQVRDAVCVLEIEYDRMLRRSAAPWPRWHGWFLAVCAGVFVGVLTWGMMA